MNPLNQSLLFLYAILCTSTLISMEQAKLHTITVHNQLPSTSQTKVTVIEVQKNAHGKSCGGTITDILPEKSIPFTKKITDKSVDFMIKIEENNQYNPMAITIKSETAREDIYVRTCLKKDNKIIISNSMQKLITLYAINKEQKQANAQVI